MVLRGSCNGANDWLDELSQPIRPSHLNPQLNDPMSTIQWQPNNGSKRNNAGVFTTPQAPLFEHQYNVVLGLSVTLPLPLIDIEVERVTLTSH